MLLHCSLGPCSNPVARAELFSPLLGDSADSKDTVTLSWGGGVKILRTRFVCATHSYPGAGAARRCPLERGRI